MPNRILFALVGYFLVVNVLAYGAMLADKMKAAAGSRRIPERTLLTLAVIGGSAGTVLAQRTVRHKTRKEPFRSQLMAILILQITAFIVLCLALVLAGTPQALWDIVSA